MKIAIIVLSGGVTIAHDIGKHYDELVDAIKETWGKDVPDNVDIFYNYGIIPGYNHNPRSGETIIIDDLLLCGIEETYENMNKKVMKSFAYFAEHTDYDYVFRCCCGSYVNIANLIQFLEDKPRKQFYCGVPTEFNNGKYKFQFASGSGFFLSKDLLLTIKENINLLCEQEISLDDATLGYHFLNLGIQIYPGKRRDIGDLPDKRHEISNLKYLTETDRKHYHFHMRHNADGIRHLHALFANA